ncbi:MAG TPA: GIY-YIG nuclease family protein [Verrucomicrobiae bacterium]|jgi:hypothetical protein|nr:GIY-YIG nuclease family protein [Verrucomicrobiae bacterium]
MGPFLKRRLIPITCYQRFPDSSAGIGRYVFAAQVCPSCGELGTLEEHEYEALIQVYVDPPCRRCALSRAEAFAALPESEAVLAPLREYNLRIRRFSDSLGSIGREMETAASAIYALTFVLDDGAEAVYVGQATNLKNRLSQHWRNITELSCGPLPSIDQVRQHLLRYGDALTFPTHHDFATFLDSGAPPGLFSWYATVLDEVCIVATGFALQTFNHWVLPEQRLVVQNPVFDAVARHCGMSVKASILQIFPD